MHVSVGCKKAGDIQRGPARGRLMQHNPGMVVLPDKDAALSDERGNRSRFVYGHTADAPLAPDPERPSVLRILACAWFAASSACSMMCSGCSMAETSSAGLAAGIVRPASTCALAILDQAILAGVAP